MASTKARCLSDTVASSYTLALQAILPIFAMLFREKGCGKKNTAKNEQKFGLRVGKTKCTDDLPVHGIFTGGIAHEICNFCKNHNLRILCRKSYSCVRGYGLITSFLMSHGCPFLTTTLQPRL